MIRLENIKFQYPQSDFKLEVESLIFAKASKSALIGPSGYGKTTMLNIIAGIILPEEGEVGVEGATINKLSDSARRNYRINNIGFVFQDFRLVPYLTVLDNIMLPFKINNSLKPDAGSLKKARELAAELKIEKLINKFPALLSHGERQRAAIARALINDPKVILADEPTGNLDPENKQRIKNILFAAIDKFKTTLITVTHDHEMLSGYDQIIDFKELRQK